MLRLETEIIDTAASCGIRCIWTNYKLELVWTIRLLSLSSLAGVAREPHTLFPRPSWSDYYLCRNVWTYEQLLRQSPKIGT